MEQDKDITPAEMLAHLKSNRFIVGIPFAALILDLLGRSLSDFDMSVFRPLEAGIFVVAGLSLLVAAHFDRQHSLKSHRIEIWLALAFGLGALRSGLWAAGMDIQDVNNIDMAFGVAGAVCVYFWTTRSSLQVAVKPVPKIRVPTPPATKIAQKPSDERYVN
ncbi:MAG: hypothetical protein NTU47_12015 [Ignavibacteriales bacterium]|nr:hypothetical protein [Ignavibacteriales bacterium]